jgi:hypothetical protein
MKVLKIQRKNIDNVLHIGKSPKPNFKETVILRTKAKASKVPMEEDFAQIFLQILFPNSFFGSQSTMF